MTVKDILTALNKFDIPLQQNIACINHRGFYCGLGDELDCQYDALGNIHYDIYNYEECSITIHKLVEHLKTQKNNIQVMFKDWDKSCNILNISTDVDENNKPLIVINVV